MLIPTLVLLAGFAVLIKGADFLVAGASSTARRYGISNLAIGLTVVAFGTSMPELIVSLLSAINGNSDASFGNVIGSNNFNLMFILGVSGIIAPLIVQRNTVKYEVPLSLLAVIILYYLVNEGLKWGSADARGGLLSRWDALALLLLFVLFLFYVYRTMRTSADLEEEKEKPAKSYSVPIALLMIVGGLGMLVFGGKLVVDNAVIIANNYGVSEKLIGLTILAVGTSLPELATSCVAAYRKNTDIAIGNVVGSNIFNIFLILGLTGVIHPIQFNPALNFDLQILMASTVALMIFMFTLNTRKLDRWEAAIMLLGYFAYMAYLITTD